MNLQTDNSKDDYITELKDIVSQYEKRLNRKDENFQLQFSELQEELFKKDSDYKILKNTESLLEAKINELEELICEKDSLFASKDEALRIIQADNNEQTEMLKKSFNETLKERDDEIEGLRMTGVELREQLLLREKDFLQLMQRHEEQFDKLFSEKLDHGSLTEPLLVSLKEEVNDAHELVRQKQRSLELASKKIEEQDCSIHSLHQQCSLLKNLEIQLSESELKFKSESEQKEQKMKEQRKKELTYKAKVKSLEKKIEQTKLDTELAGADSLRQYRDLLAEHRQCGVAAAAAEKRLKQETKRVECSDSNADRMQIEFDQWLGERNLCETELRREIEELKKIVEDQNKEVAEEKLRLCQEIGDLKKEAVEHSNDVEKEKLRLCLENDGLLEELTVWKKRYDVDKSDLTMKLVQVEELLKNNEGMEREWTKLSIKLTDLEVFSQHHGEVRNNEEDICKLRKVNDNLLEELSGLKKLYDVDRDEVTRIVEESQEKQTRLHQVYLNNKGLERKLNCLITKTDALEAFSQLRNNSFSDDSHLIKHESFDKLEELLVLKNRYDADKDEITTVFVGNQHKSVRIDRILANNDNVEKELNCIMTKLVNLESFAQSYRETVADKQKLNKEIDERSIVRVNETNLSNSDEGKSLTDPRICELENKLEIKEHEMNVIQKAKETLQIQLDILQQEQFEQSSALTTCMLGADKSANVIEENEKNIEYKGVIICQLTEEIEKLKAELSKRRNEEEFDFLSLEISKLEEETKCLQSLLHEKEVKVSQLIDKESENEILLIELRNQLLMHVQQNDRTKTSKGSMEMELNVSKAQLDSLQKQNEASEKRLKEIEELHENLIETKEKCSKEKEVIICQLQDEVSRLSDDLDIQLKEKDKINGDNEVATLQLNENLNRLHMDLESKANNEEISNVKEELAKLIKERENLEFVVKENELKLASWVNKECDQDLLISELEKKLSVNLNDKDGLELELSEWKNKFDILQNENKVKEELNLLFEEKERLLEENRKTIVGLEEVLICTTNELLQLNKLQKEHKNSLESKEVVVGQLNGQVEELNADVQSRNVEIDKLNSELVDFKVEIDTFLSLVKEKESNIERCNNVISEKELLIRELRNNLSLSLKENEELLNQNESSELELREVKIELDALQKENEAKDERTLNEEQTFAGLMKKNEELIKERDGRIALFQEEIRALKEQFAKQDEEVKEVVKLNLQVVNWETVVREKEDIVTCLNSEKVAKDQAQLLLCDRVSELMESLKHEKLGVESKHEDCMKLTEEVDKLSRELTVLKEDHLKEVSQLERKCVLSWDNSETIDNLEAELKKMRDDRDAQKAANKELCGYKSKFEIISQELESAKEDLESFRQLNEDLEKKLEREIQKTKDLIEENRTLLKGCNNAQLKLEELSSECDMIVGEREQLIYELSTTKATTEAFKTKVEQTESKFMQILDELRVTEDNLKEAVQFNSELEESVAMKSNEMKELRQQISKENERLLEKETDLAGLNDSLRSLEDELKVSESEKDKVFKDQDDLRKRMEQTNQKLESLSRENQRLLMARLEKNPVSGVEIEKQLLQKIRQMSDEFSGRIDNANREIDNFLQHNEQLTASLLLRLSPNKKADCCSNEACLRQQGKYRELSQHATCLQGQNERLRAKIVEVQQCLAQEKQFCRQVGADAVRLNSGLLERLQRLTSEHSASRSQLSEQKLSAEKAVSEVDELRQQLTELSATYSDLLMENTELLEQLELVNGRLRQQKDRGRHEAELKTQRASQTEQVEIEVKEATGCQTEALEEWKEADDNGIPILKEESSCQTEMVTFKEVECQALVNDSERKEYLQEHASTFEIAIETMEDESQTEILGERLETRNVSKKDVYCQTEVLTELTESVDESKTLKVNFQKNETSKSIDINDDDGDWGVSVENSELQIEEEYCTKVNAVCQTDGFDESRECREETGCQTDVSVKLESECQTEVFGEWRKIEKLMVNEVEFGDNFVDLRQALEYGECETNFAGKEESEIQIDPVHVVTVECQTENEDEQNKEVESKTNWRENKEEDIGVKEELRFEKVRRGNVECQTEVDSSVVSRCVAVMGEYSGVTKVEQSAIEWLQNVERVVEEVAHLKAEKQELSRRFELIMAQLETACDQEIESLKTENGRLEQQLQQTRDEAELREKEYQFFFDKSKTNDGLIGRDTAVDDINDALKETISEKEDQITELFKQLQDSKEHQKRAAENLNVVVGEREETRRQLTESGALLMEYEAVCVEKDSRIGALEKEASEINSQLEQYIEAISKMQARLVDVSSSRSGQEQQDSDSASGTMQSSQLVAMMEQLEKEYSQELEQAEARYAEAAAHSRRLKKQLHKQQQKSRRLPGRAVAVQVDDEANKALQGVVENLQVNNFIMWRQLEELRSSGAPAGRNTRGFSLPPATEGGGGGLSVCSERSASPPVSESGGSGGADLQRRVVRLNQQLSQMRAERNRIQEECSRLRQLQQDQQCQQPVNSAAVTDVGSLRQAIERLRVELSDTQGALDKREMRCQQLETRMRQQEFGSNADRRRHEATVSQVVEMEQQLQRVGDEASRAGAVWERERLELTKQRRELRTTLASREEALYALRKKMVSQGKESGGDSCELEWLQELDRLRDQLQTQKQGHKRQQLLQLAEVQRLGGQIEELADENRQLKKKLGHLPRHEQHKKHESSSKLVSVRATSLLNSERPDNVLQIRSELCRADVSPKLSFEQGSQVGVSWSNYSEKESQFDGVNQKDDKEVQVCLVPIVSDISTISDNRVELCSTIAKRTIGSQAEYFNNEFQAQRQDYQFPGKKFQSSSFGIGFSETVNCNSCNSVIRNESICVDKEVQVNNLTSLISELPVTSDNLRLSNFGVQFDGVKTSSSEQAIQWGHSFRDCLDREVQFDGVRVNVVDRANQVGCSGLENVEKGVQVGLLKTLVEQATQVEQGNQTNRKDEFVSLTKEDHDGWESFCDEDQVEDKFLQSVREKEMEDELWRCQERIAQLELDLVEKLTVAPSFNEYVKQSESRLIKSSLIIDNQDSVVVENQATQTGSADADKELDEEGGIVALLKDELRQQRYQLHSRDQEIGLLKTLRNQLQAELLQSGDQIKESNMEFLSLKETVQAMRSQHDVMEGKLTESSSLMGMLCDFVRHITEDLKLLQDTGIVSTSVASERQQQLKPLSENIQNESEVTTLQSELQGEIHKLIEQMKQRDLRLEKALGQVEKFSYIVYQLQSSTSLPPDSRMESLHQNPEVIVQPEVEAVLSTNELVQLLDRKNVEIERLKSRLYVATDQLIHLRTFFSRGRTCSGTTDEISEVTRLVIPGDTEDRCITSHDGSTVIRVVGDNHTSIRSVCQSSWRHRLLDRVRSSRQLLRGFTGRLASLRSQPRLDMRALVITYFLIIHFLLLRCWLF